MDPKKKKRLVRKLIVTGVLLGMFALFGILLRYLSVDHVHQEEEQDVTTSSD